VIINTESIAFCIVLKVDVLSAVTVTGCRALDCLFSWSQDEKCAVMAMYAVN